MIIMNIKKILLSFFVLIFFSACKGNDTEEVVSGAAQVYTSVFSKQCTGGSVHIKVETVSEVSNGISSQISTVNLDNLKVGDKVQISGTINNTVLGAVSFSCEGVVQIDTNRTFTCHSGTLGSSFVNSPVSSPASPNPYPDVYGSSTGSASPNPYPDVYGSSTGSASPNPYPDVYGASTGSASLRMLEGQVHIFQNGTQVHTRIKLVNSIINRPLPLSFTCQ